MTMPKLLAAFTVLIFAIIGLIALFKEKPSLSKATPLPSAPIEIVLDQEAQTIRPAPPSQPVIAPPTPPTAPPKSVEPAEVELVAPVVPAPPPPLPDANRIEELFTVAGDKLPIVETITYKSHVSWQKGRPAWLSDYANHYQTSRHFIARSLNGKPDYLTQEIAEGDSFNVLRKDKPFQFYLVVDTSRCKLWFYYIDLTTKEKVLLKTYSVGLGRIDMAKASGLLTPLGKYTLGSRIITYKPDMMGTYQGKRTEMITVFGTRWIPFEKEIGKCTAPAKGFGIHGTPWKEQANGKLADTQGGIGKYESDGCIRLVTPDIEELYAIVVTKPTTIEIVRDFAEASFLE